MKNRLYKEKKQLLNEQLENVKNETDAQFIRGADDMTAKHRKKLQVL